MDEQELRKVVMANLELMISKNGDYSSDNIAADGIKGVITRMTDKMVRLRHLIDTDSEISHESIEDTFRDMSNYSNIGQLVRMDKWYRTTRMVYLAGPIDDVSTKESRSWRRDIADRLGPYGIWAFNPVLAYHNGNFTVSAEIVAINKAAIAACNVTIAYLIGPGKSIGTIREIEYAISIKKPVIAIFDDSHRISLYDCVVVDSVEKAVEYITLDHQEE